MTIEDMKEKKRELGYTNEQLAAASGVPIGTVQKIFSGETKSPRYETIRKLEAALNKVVSREYKYIPENSTRVAETQAFYDSDYYSYYKSREKSYKKIHNNDYSPVPLQNRIGIAAGRFKVPDDEYFYNDEITDMFEDI